MGRRDRPRLVIERDGSVCIVKAFRTPSQSSVARILCCQRSSAAEPVAVIITAVRGLGLSVEQGRHTSFTPSSHIESVFVHEAFLHCDVISTLAVEVKGAKELLLPLEKVGYRIPLQDLREAWSHICEALQLRSSNVINQKE